MYASGAFFKLSNSLLVGHFHVIVSSWKKNVFFSEKSFSKVLLKASQSAQENVSKYPFFYTT